MRTGVVHRTGLVVSPENDANCCILWDLIAGGSNSGSGLAIPLQRRSHRIQWSRNDVATGQAPRRRCEKRGWWLADDGSQGHPCMKLAGSSHAGRVMFDTSFDGGPHEHASYARLGLAGSLAQKFCLKLPHGVATGPGTETAFEASVERIRTEAKRIRANRRRAHGG